MCSERVSCNRMPSLDAFSDKALRFSEAIVESGRGVCVYDAIRRREGKVGHDGRVSRGRRLSTRTYASATALLHRRPRTLGSLMGGDCGRCLLLPAAVDPASLFFSLLPVLRHYPPANSAHNTFTLNVVGTDALGSGCLRTSAGRDYSIACWFKYLSVRCHIHVLLASYTVEP